MNSYSRVSEIRYSCTNCNIEFSSRDKDRKFCSQTCSAIYNNFQRAEQNPKFCQECSIFITKGKFCDNCLILVRKRNGLDFDTLTLADVKNKYGTAQYHSKIRGWARTTYFRHNHFKQCEYCRYDKHIDVCHILEVQSFPLNTTLSVVNALENLIGLCKNHHWEMDNGLLKITEIKYTV